MNKPLKKQEPMRQRGHRHHTDVLVIGAGLAGLSYVLEAAENNPSLNITLIVKKCLKESNSAYAQGGLAASKNNPKAQAKHLEDTIKAGAGLSRNKIANTFIEQGQDCIHFLKKHGIHFDEAMLAQEGGHSERRIYHFGDHTGDMIITQLIQKIKTLNNVTIREYHTAIELLTQSEPHTPGKTSEVVGAYILNENDNQIDVYLSHVTVLATGGAGKVFRYTSNPDTATGDGLAMAYRAGARLGNLEFYQFHPTLLYHPEKNNLLISEALRGEGAKLLNASGERFMSHYAPEKMELATRDIVARAIFTEIEKSTENCVYLDITHHSKQYLEARFPRIYTALAKLGIHIERDLIPVVPAAHYLCGGVLASQSGQTDLTRLYAIGETAFTGLHGANRLASNSLLEACLMGKMAAEHSKVFAKKAVEPLRNIQDWDSRQVTDLRRASQINAHWRGLRGEMTSYAGIVRTQAGLEDLRQLILTRRHMIENYYQKHTVTRDVIELRNIVLVAKLIIDCALNRRESRGGHFREDYPDIWETACDTILHAKALHFDSE